MRNDASLGEEGADDDDDDDGFQRTKRRGGARHVDDDAEALREARQYLQGFDDGGTPSPSLALIGTHNLHACAVVRVRVRVRCAVCGR